MINLKQPVALSLLQFSVNHAVLELKLLGMCNMGSHSAFLYDYLLVGLIGTAPFSYVVIIDKLIVI